MKYCEPNSRDSSQLVIKFSIKEVVLFYVIHSVLCCKVKLELLCTQIIVGSVVEFIQF